MGKRVASIGTHRGTRARLRRLKGRVLGSRAWPCGRFGASGGVAMSRASSSWLSVTNLPAGSTADDFTLLFSQSGCVSSRLSSDRDGRAIGYLEFPDETSAMTARNFYAGFQVDGTGGPGLALEPTGGFPHQEEDGGRASGSKRPRAEYERRHDEYERHQPYDPENSGPAYNPPPHQAHPPPQTQYHQPVKAPTSHQHQASHPHQHQHAPYGGGPRGAEPPRWEPQMMPPQQMPPQQMPPPPQHQAHARLPNAPPPQNQMNQMNQVNAGPPTMTQPLPVPVPLPGPGPGPPRGGYGGPPGPPHAHVMHHGMYGNPPGPGPVQAGPGAPPMPPNAMGLGAPQTPHHVPSGDFIRLPPDASSTLYVEGVPADATRREMAHVFRPFEGFRSTRLVAKENVRGPLCFAEFDDARCASKAKDTLQGYLIDRDAPESGALRVSFAKTQDRKRMSGRNRKQPK